MSQRKYLDEIGLTEVAAHVNTRLKTVTVMPLSATEGAIRMYCGETTANFIKGHTYQMRATLEQRLQFSADTTTYFMTQDGTITDVAPTSYSPQIEGIPVTDPDTGAELVYMAGNNALVQRLGSDVNTITVDFNKIKSSVMPWWTAGAATGSYNPYTIRNVKLVSITEWVDITPSGSILSVGSVNDLLTAWTQMNDDSTAVVNVTTTFALNADYNIPTGRHFLLKGSDADKTTLWTNDGRIFSATLEASALVWTELHDDSKLSKVDELPSNPSVGDTVLFNGNTGTETEGHIYKYEDLTQNFTGAEVDGTFYDMNGNVISTPTSPEYSTSITVSAGGYELYVDDTAGKLFAKKSSDDSTYSVTINNDGTFTVGSAYTPESSVAAVGGNIATWTVEDFDWVDLDGDFKKTFIGTQAEWDSLSLNTKKAFDIVQIIDDFTGGVITVNTVQEGNLNPVTSNAVAVTLNTNYQKKNLTDPLTIGGAEKTTVEDALAGLNNLIPDATRPTTNPLVSRNEAVIKHNFSVVGTVDAIEDMRALVNHIITLPVGTYAGEFKRTGITFGSYSLTYFLDGPYTKSVSGTVTYSISNDNDATYQVSYVADIEQGTPPYWKIERLSAINAITEGSTAPVMSGTIYNNFVQKTQANITDIISQSPGAYSSLVRRGNIVQCIARFNTEGSFEWTQSTKIGSVPQGYRPAIFQPCTTINFQSTGATPTFISVDTNGEIVCIPLSGDRLDLYINLTWYTEDV